MADNLAIALSSARDGSMSKAVGDEERLQNRSKFLSKHNIVPEQTCLVYLTYGGGDYCRYETINKKHAGKGVVRPTVLQTDALFTTSKELALLLPIADCIAAVLHDPVHGVLGLAHFGRHNLEQNGGKATIAYMVNTFGTNPEDIKIWLSPAAGGANYPMYSFDNRSLHEVALEQLRSGGVVESNVTIDDRDTTTDDRFFSHSEFLKGNRATDGRQAVACMLTT